MAKAIRCILLAAAILAAPLAAAGEAKPGAQASIFPGDTPDASAAFADFPYQVALLTQSANGNTSPSATQFCGGFVLDSTHVGTAAHCVMDGEADLAARPSDLRVLAGTDDLNAPEPAIVNVIAVAFRPGFDPGTYDDDAAVLTLAAELPPAAAPISLLSVAQAMQAGPGDPATATGWGLTRSGDTTTLKQTTVGIVDDDASADPTCATEHGGFDGYVPERMLCAGGDGVHDTCFGDSGGPLVVPAAGALPPATPSDWRLAGIVSFGVAECATPGVPAGYAEVLAGGPAANQIDEFLQPPFAPDAPRPTDPIDLRGNAVPGETLECHSRWSNATGEELRVRRQRPTGSVDEAALPDGRYTISSAEVGWNLACVARATGPGGYGRATSANVTVAAPPSPPPGGQEPPPPPAPSQPAPPVVDPPKPADTTRPSTRLVRRRCSRTQCSLQVQVTDPPYTSGIRSLLGSGSLEYRRRCRRDGRSRMCTRKRKLGVKPVLLGAGRYSVRVRSRTPGLATLRFVAYDVAGNRQARATQIRVRFGRRR